MGPDGQDHGTNWWTLSGPIAYTIQNGVLQFHRTTASGTPQVATTLGIQYGEQWGGVLHQAPAGQRLALVFQMGNSSSTRQRVTVSLQESNASTYQSCVFWLAPSTPLHTYAMRTFAPVQWQYASVSIVPNSGGAEGTHGWLLLDNVMATHVTTPILGTECFEYATYLNLDAPAPAPVPAPTAPASETGEPSTAESDAMRALSSSAMAGGVPSLRAVPITVSIVGWGQGGVTSNIGGLTCTGQNVSCTVWFTEGTTVAFTATPGSGDSFAGWAGPCTGTGQCSLLVTSAATITATFNPPTMLTYYHTDVLGSVRATTDAVGAPLTRHDYFPFGESTLPLTGGPRGFTGLERDAESEFDYAAARYYRNVWGRFTSPDPQSIGARLVKPQTWNAYSYVENRAVTAVDSSGMWSESVHNKIIETAFGLAGIHLLPEDREILKAASRSQDDWLSGGQGPDRAFEHAMCSGSDATACRLKAMGFVQKHLEAARKALRANDRRQMLWEMGIIIHLVTDSLSPYHAGFQQWDIGGLPGMAALHGLMENFLYEKLDYEKFASDVNASVFAARLVWLLFDVKPTVTTSETYDFSTIRR